MNLREGIRRLALLLGVIGFIAGGVSSYFELQEAVHQRSRHIQFERLSNLDAVKRAIPNKATLPDYGAIAKKYEGKPREEKYAGKTPARFDANVPVEPISDSDPCDLPNICVHESANDSWRVVATQINADEIKTIFWTKDYNVESIDMQDGQMLYPTPAPKAWPYFFVAFFPVLGFFLPWGVIRALGWGIAGFFEQ